jgi:hypothetical protein
MGFAMKIESLALYLGCCYVSPSFLHVFDMLLCGGFADGGAFVLGESHAL